MLLFDQGDQRGEGVVCGAGWGIRGFGVGLRALRMEETHVVVGLAVNTVTLDVKP